MTNFQAFIRRQDAYGHAVTVNYRGDSSYKTLWGGFLTIAQNSFILIVAIIGLVDLFEFNDPNVTQFTVYDQRKDGIEYNF